MANQYQPPAPQSTNDILDVIIAESGDMYSQASTANGQNVFQKYGSSLLARNPLTIVATIIPVSLLLVGSLVFAGHDQKSNIQTARSDNTAVSSQDDTSGTNNEGSADEDTTNSTHTADNTNTATPLTVGNAAPAGTITINPTQISTKPVAVNSPTPVTPTPPSPGILGEVDISSLAKCTKKVTQSKRAHFSPYPLNNSTAGDKKACNEGYGEIDHDFLISKDGVVVNTHWQDLSTDGFVSSKSSKKRVDQHTWAELANLKSDGYQIRSAYQTFKQTCSVGIDVFFEAKNDSRFENKATWTPLAGYAQKFCGKNWKDIIKVATQCSGGETAANRRLAAARSAGFSAPTKCF